MMTEFDITLFHIVIWQYHIIICQMRGRYNSPPLPVDQRLCPSYEVNQIEDGIHFLVQFSKYKDNREVISIKFMTSCQL